MVSGPVHDALVPTTTTSLVLRDAQRGGRASERHQLAGIVRRAGTSASAGLDDIGERERRPLHLDEMNVGRARDPSPGHGLRHGRGGQVDLLLPPDILGQEGRREGHAHRQRLAVGFPLVGRHREDRVMRRQHTLDPAGEDERHPLADGLRAFPGMPADEL